MIPAARLLEVAYISTTTTDTFINTLGVPCLKTMVLYINYWFLQSTFFVSGDSGEKVGASVSNEHISSLIFYYLIRKAIILINIYI